MLNPAHLRNPPPTPETDKCISCETLVQISDKAIQCDVCNKWIHITCQKFSNKDYKYYQENENLPFLCKICIKDCFPFSEMNNHQFLNLTKKDRINIPKETPSKCGICKKTVGKNHNAIECSTCLNWIHIKCNKFEKKDYYLLCLLCCCLRFSARMSA